jgi:hypothetical protein
LHQNIVVPSWGKKLHNTWEGKISTFNYHQISKV